jgi:mRNA interferase MazF
MKRGDLYRVRQPSQDPKQARTYVVVSRQRLIDSRFSTVVCAPVYSQGEGLTTQVRVGIAEGLKHDSWITCDNLVSVPKVRLTDYLGSLSAAMVRALDRSLRVALGLD